MIKRSFDIFFSFCLIIFFLPVFLVVSFLIWQQDFFSPLYVSKRIGKEGIEFKFYKFRSMKVNADTSGVNSTSANDSRITFIGKIIRKFKIDELPQLINVLFGQMSLVGPRPNVQADVSIYTEIEQKLLKVKPGITDFSSIVFSDEGEILEDSKNPDLKYNQVIRPWKSRLGLLYIEKSNFLLDIKLIVITIISIFSRKYSLILINMTLKKLDAGKKLINICLREKKLTPYPPPGKNEIVATIDFEGQK
ncbi:MAG: sugar transferase [Rickettsiales bacterium TMED289]|nr:MAG: sugar transferase [Rickettsiales bacterium TMED289]